MSAGHLQLPDPVSTRTRRPRSLSRLVPRFDNSLCFGQLEASVISRRRWPSACPERQSNARPHVKRSANQRERQMKPTRHVTAVLLLAAFAAVGCSKRGETSQAKAASRRRRAAETGRDTRRIAAVKRTDGEGFVAGRDAEDHRSGVIRRWRGGIPGQEVQRRDGDLRTLHRRSAPPTRGDTTCSACRRGRAAISRSPSRPSRRR